MTSKRLVLSEGTCVPTFRRLVLALDFFLTSLNWGFTLGGVAI